MAATMGKAKLKIYEDDSEVSDEVCKFIVEIANKSIKQHGAFYVGLSGKSCHDQHIQKNNFFC